MHLDPVLAKLDQVARAELSKKPTGLLGFMKDTKVRSAADASRGRGCRAFFRCVFLDEEGGRSLLHYV